METALCALAIAAILLGHGLKAISLNVLRPNTTTLVSIALLLGNCALLFFLLAPDAYAALGPNYRSSVFFPTRPAYLAQIHFWMTLGWLVGAPSGRFLTSRVIRIKWRAPSIWISEGDRLLMRYWRPILTFCIIASVAYVMVIGGIERLPLYMMFKGVDTMEILWAREEAFKYLPWYQAYPFHVLRAFAFPVLVIFAYLAFRCSRSKLRDAVRLFIIFAIAASFNASSSALGPILALVMFIGFAELMLRKSWTLVAIVRVIVVAALIFPVHYVMVGLTSGEWLNPIDDAIQLLTEQIAYRGYTVVENGAVFNLAFPPEAPIGFGGNAKLAHLFGVSPVSVNNTLFNVVAPASKIYSGTYNGAWFHYDMIMFGPLGVLIGALMTGGTVGGIDEYFRRRDRSVMTTSLYVFSIVVTLGLMDRPYTTWLVSHGGILGVALDMVLRKLFVEKAPQLPQSGRTLGPRIPPAGQNGAKVRL